MSAHFLVRQHLSAEVAEQITFLEGISMTGAKGLGCSKPITDDRVPQ